MAKRYFEHSPWVGKDYKSGKRVCIVGYSHYTDQRESDRPSLTNDVMKKVLAGNFGDTSFWSSIPSYFDQGGSSKHVRVFWNSVLFFNFLPQAVGTEMFATGSKEQHEAARKRFNRVMEQYKPVRVFVFSKKAWEALPPMEEESHGGILPRTGRGDQWGTYSFNGSPVIAVGLRHPLFASAEEMKGRVAAALAVPNT